MSEIDRISDQLKRAFEGEAWHGPSVREVLDDVDASRAAARPIKEAHSIWEIVLHVIAWEAVVRRRLEGDPAQISEAEDWPAVTDRSETAWKSALARLEEGHQRLRRTISSMQEANLDSAPAGGSTAYVLAHGAIQHDLYHAGQIALLKKSR